MKDKLPKVRILKISNCFNCARPLYVSYTRETAHRISEVIHNRPDCPCGKNPRPTLPFIPYGVR